ISDEAILYIKYVVLYSAEPMVILFGLGANIFNIFVFTRMGLKDSVTVSLCSLAISDIWFLLIRSMVPSSLIIILFPRVAPRTIDITDVAYACFWYSMVFYDTSMLIRVYTAVTRACCVAIPLTFRNTFTKKVTIYVVGTVFCLSLATRMPLLVCQGFQSVFDSKANMTKLVLSFTALRPAALAVSDIVNRNIITWGAIIVVLISLFVLKLKLVSAAKFRLGAHNSNVTSELKSRNKSNALKFLHKRDKKAEVSLSSSVESNSFLVGKDLQVLKVVILVSVIFIFCAVPPAVSGVIRQLVPDFNIGGRYGTVFQVITTVFDCCSYLNASLNVFVYYNYNTKFRQ
ncbi:unnamed protein product, partial [Lymnaea stagnalis]